MVICKKVVSEGWCKESRDIILNVTRQLKKERDDQPIGKLYFNNIKITILHSSTIIICFQGVQGRIVLVVNFFQFSKLLFLLLCCCYM